MAVDVGVTKMNVGVTSGNNVSVGIGCSVTSGDGVMLAVSVGSIVAVGVSEGNKVAVIVGVRVAVALGVMLGVDVAVTTVTVGGTAVGGCVGRLVAVGISTVGRRVAVGGNVLVGSDVGVEGSWPGTAVLLGVGEITAGRVGGVTMPSRGALDSK